MRVDHDCEGIDERACLSIVHFLQLKAIFNLTKAIKCFEYLIIHVWMEYAEVKQIVDQTSMASNSMQVGHVPSREALKITCIVHFRKQVLWLCQSPCRLKHLLEIIIALNFIRYAETFEPARRRSRLKQVSQLVSQFSFRYIDRWEVLRLSLRLLEDAARDFDELDHSFPIKLCIRANNIGFNRSLVELQKVRLQLLRYALFGCIREDFVKQGDQLLVDLVHLVRNLKALRWVKFASFKPTHYSIVLICYHLESRKVIFCHVYVISNRVEACPGGDRLQRWHEERQRLYLSTCWLHLSDLDRGCRDNIGPLEQELPWHSNHF